MFQIMQPYGYGKKKRKRLKNSPHYGGLFSQNYLDDVMGLGFHTDIIDKTDKFIIEAELPGVEKEDISVELEEDELTISATKKTSCDASEDDYICQERNLGTFERKFKVTNIKEEDIKAEYNNGVLKVELPKLNQEIMKQRKIEIE